MPGLTSLQGLHNLQSTYGININHLSLVDLHGLESLSSVHNLGIYDNAQLSSLSGMSLLSSVSGWAGFERNPLLSQCEIAAFEAQIGRPLDWNSENGPACGP